MSTTAIITANTAIAVSAAAGRKATCTNVLNTYNPKDATISQMQTYAQCVNYTYPQQLSQETVIGFKQLGLTFLVCLLLGAVFLSIKNFNEDHWFANIVFGAVAGAAVFIFGGLLLALIIFVFA